MLLDESTLVKLFGDCGALALANKPLERTGYAGRSTPFR